VFSFYMKAHGSGSARCSTGVKPIKALSLYIAHNSLYECTLILCVILFFPTDFINKHKLAVRTTEG
jgi:hypothetical protein